MEEKGRSSEERAQMGMRGVESDDVVVTNGQIQQQWVESGNAVTLRQWMYHPYLPQNSSSFITGASSNAYQALPTKRDEERRTSTQWKVRPSSQVFSNSTWYGAGPMEAPSSAI